MGIVMWALAPHPPWLVPGSRDAYKEHLQSTINAMERLTELIAERSVERLVIISPHTPPHSEAIPVFKVAEWYGSLSAFYCPYRVHGVPGETECVDRLQEACQKLDFPIVVADESPLWGGKGFWMLDHGAVVPLYFLRKAGLNPSIMLIGASSISPRYYYDLGRILAGVLNDDVPTVVLASGELAQCLLPDGIFGYHASGAVFDAKIMEALSKPDAGQVLAIDENIVEESDTCGYRPILLMLGSMEGREVRSEVLSYEGPFGIGYGVVAFLPGGSVQDSLV